MIANITLLDIFPVERNSLIHEFMQLMHTIHLFFIFYIKFCTLYFMLTLFPFCYVMHSFVLLQYIMVSFKVYFRQIAFILTCIFIDDIYIKTFALILLLEMFMTMYLMKRASIRSISSRCNLFSITTTFYPTLNPYQYIFQQMSYHILIIHYHYGNT